MSTYRMLRPHSVGPFYFDTFSVAATAEVGGLLPTGFVPTGNMEPLDQAGVNAFYRVGPQFPDTSGMSTYAPATYWQLVNRRWKLMGPLATGLAPI